MTEKEILGKIDAWYQQNRHQAIVDFVEPLPLESKTSKVLSELARAYNNLYWQDSHTENEKWLRKAVDILLYIEGDVPEEELYRWHFRIAYSYFYLGENALAKQHILKYIELNVGEIEPQMIWYLECIDLAEEENRRCAEVYNNGDVRVNDHIKIFKKVLAKKAPAMLPRLGNPTTEEALERFEKSLSGGGLLGFLKSKMNGIKLLQDFKDLHLNFSGQADAEPFFYKGNERFVSLEEIPAIQQKIIEKLTQNFGKDWKDIKLPEPSENEEENNGNVVFTDSNTIKNTLYHTQWLPLLAGDNYYICVDLDPANEKALGQVILVSIAEHLDHYEVSWLFHDISEWIGYIKNKLQEEALTYDEESHTLKFAEREYTPPLYNDEAKTKLRAYITQNFGTIIKTISDPDYDEQNYDINCEVLVVEPNENRDYYTLITLGAGAYISNAPQGEPYSTEFIINLPKTWNPESINEQDTAPIDWLRTIARVPIRYNTWLGHGHSIPIKLEGTDYTGAITVVYTLYDEEKDNHTPYIAEITEDHKLSFIGIAPIYKEEMDYKLDHTSDELFDRFMEHNIGYPPVLEEHRRNTCEGYEIRENPHLLDGIAWAFGNSYEPSLTNFWGEVFRYNKRIDNDLEDYTPFATIFNTKKVKVLYDAWIKDKTQLLEYEILIDASQLEGNSDENGLYQVQIIAECESSGDTFLAIELLQWINNLLYNKELGDHIFFEGLSLEGREEDGTPVVYLELGS